jgi:hypothetical protein
VAGLAAGPEAGDHAAEGLDGGLVCEGDLNAPAAMKVHLAEVLLWWAIADLAGEADR